MKVSVIVPCYNAAPYLAQTVGSALDQTSPPHEIIIVDDGSSDASLDIALRIREHWPDRVHVFSERSGRAARTRNLGAQVATGDAFLFLDADDVLAPETVRALDAALAGEPGGVAICPWYRLELDGERWVQRPPSCSPRRPGDDPLSAWLKGWYHPPCAVLWSRDAFERAGRWDERAMTNDDGDLMMRALALGIPLVAATSGAGYYRRRADGALSLSGQRFSREALGDRIRVVRKVGRWVERQGQAAEYRDALCEAFFRIAADAGDRQPDLRAHALTCAGRYAPPFWTKVRRRLSTLRAARRRRDAQPRGDAATHCAAEEVRFGQDRVAGALGSGAAPRMGRQPGRITRPGVSIIIPTYNRAGLLRRAIDSVLAQSYDDYELLVVDDGSTDDTATAVSGYGDRRVRYIRQDNAGVAAARNRGLRESRADLIAFLDSDDEWMPHKLARQVALLETLSDRVGLVYTGVENVREDRRTAIVRPRERGDVYTKMLAANILHGAGSSAMIRRCVVATAGFFNEELPAIEDYEYWLRVTCFFEVDYVDEPLIRYHDPRGELRRSLALRANLDARWCLYREHVSEMRQAGAAHLFLLKSARRALTAAEPDVRAARRLAMKAVLEAPTSRLALAGLAETLRRRHTSPVASESPSGGRT